MTRRRGEASRPAPKHLLILGCSGGGGGGGSGGTNPPEPTAFLTACDPVAQTGCSAGKKCTWVRLTSVVARSAACRTARWLFCFDYTYYRFDTDRDGVPDTQLPSCTTLSATAFNFSATVSDAEYWGCVAR